MSADPNRQLFVISAHGHMRWSYFCEAVDFLSTESLERNGTSDVTATRSGLLQCLEALGHCEAYYDKGQSIISVTPPALCRLPRVGLPVFVLTGDRNLRTQEQLAEAAEISVDFLSSMERGVNAPSFETLEKLSQALDVPVKELFDFNSHP